MGTIPIPFHRFPFDLKWPFNYNRMAFEELAYTFSNYDDFELQLVGDMESAQGLEPITGVTLTDAVPICPSLDRIPVSLASRCQLFFPSSTAGFADKPDCLSAVGQAAVAPQSCFLDSEQFPPLRSTI